MKQEGKETKQVLTYEDYVEKASRLYNLALEGKVSRVYVSVRKRWCTVYLKIDKTKDHPQWGGVYDFVGEEHLDNGYTNEDEWKRLERQMEEIGVKL